MSVVFSSRAARDFEGQLEFLLSAGAVEPARDLRQRVLSFVDDFLAIYPKAGTHIPERDLYEIWIPHTRFVLIYRIENDRDVRVLALFHTSQARSKFEPGGEG